MKKNTNLPIILGSLAVVVVAGAAIFANSSGLFQGNLSQITTINSATTVRPVSSVTIVKPVTTIPVTSVQAPTLSTPANGAVNVPIKDTAATPTFKWSPGPSTGTNFYMAQVSTNKDFSSTGYTPTTEAPREINYNAGQNSATIPAATGLRAGTTYYWHVKTQNSNAGKNLTSDWSPTWSFTTAGAVIPTLSTPANGASKVALKDSTAAPTFTWANTGAVLYVVEVSTNQDFSPAGFVPTTEAPKEIHYNAGQNSATIPAATGLRAGTTYYWHVKGQNAVTNPTVVSSWSPTWSFTTDGVAPTLSTPADGATNVPVKDAGSAPTFSWSNTGAVLYVAEVSTNKDFSPAGFVPTTEAPKEIHYNAGQASATVPAATGLRAGTTYYWHVKAQNAVTNPTVVSSWSPTWSFTTASGSTASDQSMNRALFAKFLVTSTGAAINSTGGPHFADVPQNAWFYDYAETAYNNGWMTASPDGMFRPADTVLRSDATKIFELAFLEAKHPFSPGATDPACEYADVKAGDWFHDYVNMDCHYKILDVIPTPANSSFLPGSPMTSDTANVWLNNLKNSPLI